MPDLNTYCLIDSGHGRKLEQFGPYRLSRPCAQAVWAPRCSQREWDSADATFSREQGLTWTLKRALPDSWTASIAGINFKIMATDFGHLGVFPEQRPFWHWMRQKVHARATQQLNTRILNLFAYSGGATLAAAQGGAAVCHLDASKGMVAWARENASLNQLERAPIRWIVEDVKKFLKREQQRASRYEGIILDPPSFGRGTKGEVFKIEEDLPELLSDCRQLLSETPLFLFFSCHTPGFSPLVMRHLMTQTMQGCQGSITHGEMTLEGAAGVWEIPSGTYARWEGGHD